jgi:hypothetical protein
MLRDGRFIKEEPPKIGANYFPLKPRTALTEEEEMMQEVLLGRTDKDSGGVLAVFVWVGIMVAVANGLYILIKG